MISLWLLPVVYMFVMLAGYRVYQDARQQSPWMRRVRVQKAKRIVRGAIFALILSLSMGTTTVFLFGWEICGWFVCTPDRPDAGGW